MGPVAIKAILRRPWLAAEFVRVAAAFSARGWWRRPPFLPRPHPEYLEWRMHTHHPDGVVSAADIASFLTWRRRFRAASRRHP